MEADKRRPIIDATSPVMGIYAENSFNLLTDAEKNYAY